MPSPGGPSEDQASTRVFVGRHRELAELRAALADAVDGRVRLFLVVGEPGIGKTRLVEELSRDAADRGGVALWGRCWEAAGAPPYWPWAQILRTCLRNIGTERPPSVLAHLVPELRTDSSPPPLQSDHARFYLFDAVAAFLESAAAHTPLLVVVDDLQWADTPSLLLMQFLAHQLRDARILLLGTYREVEVRESPEVAELLGAIERDGHHVPLRGFGEDEVGLFIEARTGERASPDLVRLVHRETEGNPFFVDETVRLLVAERALQRPAEKLAVPQGVREAIRRRIAPLPRTCSEVLTVAAVIGRDFDIAILRRACELEGPRLLDVLGPAVMREIIVQDPHAGGRYRFAHALIRETLYEALPPAELARRHARIGDVLEDLHPPPLAALAHHFLQAAPVGGADKAITYSVQAGRHAAASLAYEAAAAHFQDALDALAQARPTDDRERCELLLARGEAQWRSADGRGARDTFGEAAAIARKLGDPALLARSALGFAGEGSRLLWVRTAVVDRPRIELLEEAIRELGDREPALRARLLARLAINLYWAPDSERVLALSDTAVSLARELNDPRDLAAVLRARWVALWRPETAEERLTIADELVTMGERTHDRELVLLGRRLRIVGFLEFGDVAAADREIARWAEIAAEQRQPLWLADLAMWRATRAIMDGRFAEGEQHAQQAFQLGEREPELEAAMRYAVQTSVLPFHRGDAMESAALPASGGSMLLRSFFVLLASETGREADARRELAALATDGFRLHRDGGWLTYLSLLSAAAAQLKDEATSAVLYDLLRPYSGRLAIVGAGLACWGSVSYYLGLLASTLGRVADATSHFEEAASVHDRIGARPFLAWTWFAHGRLLAGSDAGSRLLASALAMAEELGIRRLVAKIGALGFDSRAAEEPASGEAIFRHEGDFWTVAYAGKSVRVRHGKGLGDLAILLGNPGRQIHVADLIAASSGAPSDPRSGADIVAQGLRVSQGATGGAVLDRRARDDYRERLGELHRELEDAERCNDEGRAARARAELDFIAGELASAFGLGGRSRRAGSPIERARKAVASRIRFSVSHIARVHPQLADHLRRYIRTGTVCTYVVPDEPVTWRL